MLLRMPHIDTATSTLNFAFYSEVILICAELPWLYMLYRGGGTLPLSSYEAATDKMHDRDS
jgi:hypothetical protein